MNFNVTPDMVSKIKVDDACNSQGPCSHECVVTLKNGRTSRGSMTGVQINLVVREVAKEILETIWPVTHFQYRDSFIRMHYMCMKSPPSAAEILTDLFSEVTSGDSE